MRFRTSKPIRFLLVGGGVFCIDFSLLWFLKSHLPPLVAFSIAYIAGVTSHFLLNRFWVFEAHTGSLTVQLHRYLLNVAATYLCSLLFAFLSLHYISPNVLIAKFIAVPPTTLLGFVLLKSFVFADRHQRSPLP